MAYRTPQRRTNPLFEDMADQTHLLVAGATGSGKSVVINGIMATLLFRLPVDVPGGAQFILIDPKRVELSVYKNLPHTICYASEHDAMVGALNLAVSIMETRFKMQQAKGQKKYVGSDIYIVIDEFADLMTTCKVVPVIQRLAQKGRAARIHIILATQTPIAAIIPTKIKCNFDSRVGLRTRSAQDSRNIIGYSGLEKLPRYGRAYYMTPERESYLSIPYVTDDKIEKLVAYWEKQKWENDHPLRAWLKKVC